MRVNILCKTSVKHTIIITVILILLLIIGNLMPYIRYQQEIADAELIGQYSYIITDRYTPDWHKHSFGIEILYNEKTDVRVHIPTLVGFRYCKIGDIVKCNVYQKENVYYFSPIIDTKHIQTAEPLETVN